MNEETDVRELLRTMSAEVGPLRMDPDAVARKAGFRLLRTAVLGVIVVMLFAVGGFVAAQALRSPYRERPASHAPVDTSAAGVIAQSSLVSLPRGERFDLDEGVIRIPEKGDASSDVALARRQAGSLLVFANNARVVALGDASYAALSLSDLKGLSYERATARLSPSGGEVFGVRTSEGNYSKVQVIECFGSSSRPFVEFRFVTYG